MTWLTRAVVLEKWTGRFWSQSKAICGNGLLPEPLQALELLVPILPKCFGAGQYVYLYVQGYNEIGYPCDWLHRDYSMDL